MPLPLPELIRRSPARTLGTTVRVPVAGVPLDAELRLAEAAGLLGLGEIRHEVPGRYRLEMPWRTHVCGVKTVKVREELDLTLTAARLEACLRLECLPQKTHDAHAVGIAWMLAGGAAFGVFSYPVGGLLPGATLILGGGLWADATRTMAMTTLERRLEVIATELASAIWPGAPPWPGGASGVGSRLPSSQSP